MFRISFRVFLPLLLCLPLAAQTSMVRETVTRLGHAPLLQEKTNPLGRVINYPLLGPWPPTAQPSRDLGPLAPAATPPRGSRNQSFSAGATGGLQNAFLLDGPR